MSIDWDNPDNYSIAKLIADPLVEDYNQHTFMGLVGQLGKGKSEAAIRMAYDASRYLADKKGGVPEDYFTFENIAIITMDEIIRVKKIQKRFGIYIYDDIGVGWNARDWNKKANKILNKIAMTARTKRNIIILTAPDDEHIDKVPRNLFNYRVDMEQALFKIGYSVGKFREVKRDYKGKRLITPYIKVRTSTGLTKFARAKFTRAPRHITELYEKHRDEIQDKMEQDDIKELEEINSELKGTNAEKQSNKKADILRPGIFAFHEDGMNQTRIAQKVGCSQKLVSTILRGEA